ncbi:hypothetical protein R4J18_09865 [Brachyspira pilosicoli]|uniref:hypothetical protein n=1 Tax=Brachyspira pilosicoli TaxID=52584 RepID=UPI00300715D5
MINIVNAYGTSNDKSSKYGYESWIEYWSKLKGINSDKFTICPNCLNIIDNNNKIVGAHVYICSLYYNIIYTIYIDAIFIIPICHYCNISKIGYDADICGLQKIDIMQIDENLLIPHPDYL